MTSFETYLIFQAEYLRGFFGLCLALCFIVFVVTVAILCSDGPLTAGDRMGLAKFGLLTPVFIFILFMSLLAIVPSSQTTADIYILPKALKGQVIEGVDTGDTVNRFKKILAESVK